MPSLFTELRRRNVFKVGAAYAIVAWLLIEVVSTVFPLLNLPEWAAVFVTVLLIIGFPITLLMAWAYEMTPEGIKHERNVAAEESISQATGQRLNYVILGLVVLAVGFLVVDQYVLDQGMRASVIGSSVSTAPVPETAGSTPSAPSSAQVVRFTINLESTEPVGDDDGLSAHVAFSPDGRLLVYAGQVEGKSQLYLHRLDEFDTQPMPGTEGAIYPFFSPDGQWVAFYDETEDEELKRISVRGGSPQRLADIVFSGGGSWELDDTIVYGTGDGTVGRNLYRIPANGGTPEVLLASDTEKGYVTPEVLPGGDAVLFLIRPGPGGSRPATDGRIAVLSLETHEVRTLIEGGYRPQYAPTGHIVFFRGGDLWAVPFDVGRLETTGPEVLVLEGVQTEAGLGTAAYAFSDNGILVYVPGGDTVDAWTNRIPVWVDRQGREEPLDVEPRTYSEPRISPDGTKVAMSVLDGGNWDVWIHDLTRNVLGRLTSDPGFDDSPLWTPDGQGVVFRSEREGAGLYWRAANGTGEVTRLYSGPANGVAPNSFSPDGMQLVFAQVVQSIDLHVLSLAGEPAPQLLLQTQFHETSAAISPDGRWLAYHSDETGQNEVYVRPFPNVDDDRWQISPDGGSEPLWGPDSDELFYRSSEGVMAVPVETEPRFLPGGPGLLFPDTYADRNERFTGYDVSLDGERFLMLKLAAEQTEQNSVPTQLRVVQNWFEELKRLAPASE